MLGRIWNAQKIVELGWAIKDQDENYEKENIIEKLIIEGPRKLIEVLLKGKEKKGKKREKKENHKYFQIETGRTDPPPPMEKIQEGAHELAPPCWQQVSPPLNINMPKMFFKSKKMLQFDLT